MADGGRSRRARTMEDGGAGRCLSDLSDDLLRHILFLAPDRDGAATAVLSRRWRWLWRTSGAVYLDSRSFNGGCSSREQQCLAFLRGAEKALAEQEREAFLRGAEKALAAAAAHGPIRRLTFFIAEDSKIILLTRWWSEQHYLMEHNLMETLVSNPAARRVEELRIEVKPLNTRFTLSFGSLPCEALRVLRITRCSTLTAGAASRAFFPMLADLHLQNCSVSLVDLQRIIDAAPRLSALHLASSHFSTETKYTMHGEEEDVVVVGRLLIPAVSALVLAGCTHGYKASLELDVPRLQCFRYRGHVEDTNRLSLKPQASANMVHVDLHLTNYYRNAYTKGAITPARELFWRFLQNFNTTKLLKLRLESFTMDDLALLDTAKRDELLGGLSFSLLEQLELHCCPGFQISTAMLAGLLHCCPVLRDLRIKFIKKHRTPWIESSTDNEAGAQFDKSVSGFRNRRSRSMVSLGRENDDNYQACDVIHGLTSERSFSCLQSHLKRVSLHFVMDEPNCVGVQVAKFFAKNAMALQEMHIDDGSQEMLEHVNSSVRRWIANNTDNGNNQLNVRD